MDQVGTAVLVVRVATEVSYYVFPVMVRRDAWKPTLRSAGEALSGYYNGC